MTTKIKPAGVLSAFEPAYAAAVGATTDLRRAYEDSDAAQRALGVALADDREAARVAFVAGRDHAPSGRVSVARDALGAAHKRVQELKSADQVRQTALSLAVRDLVDAGGRDALAGAIERLVDAGTERLALAVDELAASRRQIAQTLSMLNWLDGPRTGGLREANALTRVVGIAGANGEEPGWDVVEDALRAMGDTARECLRSFVDRPPAPQPVRVSIEEMLQWHIAAGGSYSDSTADVRDNYLERGPRSADAARDVHDQETGRSRDQRTWADAA